MLGMLLDFNVTYVRNIADNPAMWSADMDYLRSRVSTNRSMVADRLSMEDNRLYEGAKTLVDMLDYLRLIKTGFILNEVHIEVNNDTSFPHAMLAAVLRTFSSDGTPLGPITIYFIYTNVGQKTVNGAFITSIQAKRGDCIPLRSGVGGFVIRDYFGNVPALEKYVDLDRPYCYKAGPSLRYSENMPTPSEYINELDMCITDACVYLQLGPVSKEDNDA